MKRKCNDNAERRISEAAATPSHERERAPYIPTAVEANPLTLPGSRARRLILAALRVWELKNGIQR
jgi:hypothetical protein